MMLDVAIVVEASTIHRMIVYFENLVLDNKEGVDKT